MHDDAVLIAGPTASGKSQAAMELAEQIGGVVIVRLGHWRSGKSMAGKARYLVAGFWSMETFGG